MKRYLTLFSAMLLLYASDASAQQRQADFPIPATLIPPGGKPAQLRAKLRHVTWALYDSRGGMLKSTSGTERLKALADYNLTLAPGSQIRDSLSFTYSPGRGSAFDFFNLTYDYYNDEDLPVYLFASGAHIQFDTLRTYVPPGSSTSSVYGVRIYNSAGKVIRNENPNYVYTFIYDGANRLIRSTYVVYNWLTGSWDSSARNFYRYDAAGYLVLDSQESWYTTSSTYKPNLNSRYTNNAAGYPTQVLVDEFHGPVATTIAQYDITYGIPATRPSLFIAKQHDGVSLQNTEKDTFGYSGTMLNFIAVHSWDTATNAWMLYYKERRHLNGASLPDSVWYQNYDSGLPIDSGVVKLAYNGQDNPTYLRTYAGANTTPDQETRWYYESLTGVGVAPSVAKKQLVIYPNPATDNLYLKGTTEGQYYIHNAAGQVVQSGFLQAGAAVPVHLLSPGVYSITLLDGARAATFIRQ